MKLFSASVCLSIGALNPSLLDFDQLMDHVNEQIITREDVQYLIHTILDETPEIIFRPILGLSDQLWVPGKLHFSLIHNSVRIRNDISEIERIVAAVGIEFPEFTTHDMQTMAYRWWTYCVVPFNRDQIPEESLWFETRRKARRGFRMKDKSETRFLADLEIYRR